MKSNSTFPDMRYDFSYLSKGRLRAYNRMLAELDKESKDVRELNEDEIEFLAAAGNIHTNQENPTVE